MRHMKRVFTPLILFLIALFTLLALSACDIDILKADEDTESTETTAKEEYLISLITNGGTNDGIMVFKEGEPIYPEEWTEREGYTFGGWFTDAELTQKFDSTVMPTENLTLFAWWTEEDKPADFEYGVVDGTVVIKGYTASDLNVSIPSYIDGRPVTTIEMGAFDGRSDIVSLRLPPTLTDIGKSALDECVDLRVLEVPDIELWLNLRFDSAIDNPLIHVEEFLIDGVAVTELTIPKGITEIKPYAFAGYGALKSVVLSEDVRKIGDGAFVMCDGLESVYISKYTQDFGREAFYGCTGMKEVHIENMAVWCGSSFDGPTSNPLYYANNLYMDGQPLSTIVIPENTMSIEEYTFINCTGATRVILSKWTREIADTAFMGCDSLTMNEYSNAKYIGSLENEYLYLHSAVDKSVRSIEVHESTILIAPNAFKGCASLETVNIHNGVKRIGDSAFDGCTSLLSVTLPDNIQSIGECTFKNCAKLGSVVIPDSVRTIEDEAFSGCEGLVSVTLGREVASIGSKAFYGCQRLTALNVPIGTEYIGAQAFYNCISLKEVKLPRELMNLGEDAFKYCDGITRLTAPAHFMGEFSKKALEWVEINKGYSVLSGTFADCSKLTEVVLCDDIATIEANAFRYCSSLTKVNLSNFCINISPYAFSGCSSIEGTVYENGVYLGNTGNPYMVFVRPVNTDVTSVTIHEETMEITAYAFVGCNKLESIVIPDLYPTNAWYRIEPSVFSKCPADVKITFGGTVARWENICDDSRHVNGKYRWEVICNNGIATVDYSGS